MSNKLTREELAEFAEYDKEAGTLIRTKCTAARHKLGMPIGAVNSNGHRQLRMKDKGSYYVSHLVWLWFHGEYPQGILFRKDMNPSNDSIENLEVRVKGHGKKRLQGQAFVDEAKRSFDYVDGRLVRKAGRGANVEIGKVDDTLNTGGYRVVSMWSVVYSSHRVIWAIAYGEDPGDKFIDHIDGNRTNNQLSNLRLVTVSDNNRNVKRRSDNKTGVTGVSLIKKTGKYSVEIQDVNKKKVFIGYYDDLEEAKRARQLAEKKHNYHENHGRDVD